MGKDASKFLLDSVREKAISISEDHKGKIDDDIGACTGFITEGLVCKGLRVIAVNQSEAMLTEMRKKLAYYDGIDYRIGEAESLPVSDEVVDYIFCQHVFTSCGVTTENDKGDGKNSKAVGKLVITDLNEHTFEFLKDEHRDRWTGFEREDIRKWFIKAGLKEVIVYSVGENCCAQSCHGDEYASISIFITSGEK